MIHVEIEVHDDEWEEFECVPDSAWQALPSKISIHYTRMKITDPVWITYFALRYPWTTQQDAA